MATQAIKRRVYRKPPVVEALCELVFEPGEWDDTVPGRLYELISGEYPGKRTLPTVTADITLTPEEARAGVRRSANRVQFLSRDGKQIVQVEPDLLVINQLAPYPEKGFESWKPVVHGMLAHYKKLCAPRSIKRMGLRYLNCVTIPKVEFELDEYFAAYPHLPVDSPVPHSDFLMRVEIPERDSRRRLLLTLSSASGAPGGSSSFVLDLYFLSDVSQADPFDQLSNELDRAHEAIQGMFERSITDRTRGLFGVEDRG